MLRLTVSFVRLCGLLALSLPAFSQTAYLAKGNQELNVFGGLSYGLDSWRGSFGGNYAFSPFDKYVMVYGEYSYFPGIRRTIDAVPNNPATLPPTIQGGTTEFRFHDLHGGVHIRLPIFPEKRIVPYVAAGIGWLGGEQTGTVQQLVRLLPPNNTPVYQPQNLGLESNGAAFNTGGGFRFYLSDDGRFGFRLEAKMYKPMTGDYTQTFGKISLGIFYQLR